MSIVDLLISVLFAAVKVGVLVALAAILALSLRRAPAVARQPGRVGDVIRVQMIENHQSLQARVIDSHTAEVVR